MRIVGLGHDGAVGRLRLAGSDADIEQAVAAIHRAMEGTGGRVAVEEADVPDTDSERERTGPTAALR